MRLMSFLSPVMGSCPRLHLQLHDHSEPLLPDVHGAGLDLLCVHDCEEHSSRERAAPQRDSKSDGGQQWGHVVHVVHRQLYYDDYKYGSAHLHHHGEKTDEWDKGGRV